MRTMMMLWVGAALVMAGCQDQDAGDGGADDALDATAEGAPLADKADAIALDGLYETTATSLKSGDVPDVQFLPDGRYVRARCYHAGCKAPVAETDRYDVFKSSGHTYVRFWSFTVVTDADGNRDQQPKVADTYELRKTAHGIKLRKTYSSRWLTLDAVTQTDVCEASGGTWNGSAPCLCPGGNDLLTTHGAFVPGAGGCILIGGGGEDACDSSNGLYTDDDSTLIGTYCICGLGRHVGPGPGACVAN
jgi:hypothetical protein